MKVIYIFTTLVWLLVIALGGLAGLGYILVGMTMMLERVLEVLFMVFLLGVVSSLVSILTVEIECEDEDEDEDEDEEDEG